MSALGPVVAALVARILRDDIGGAAEMAEESARAIEADIMASQATSVQELQDRCRSSFGALLEAAPSVSPVTNVLHQIGAALEGSPNSDPSDLTETLRVACHEAATWVHEGLQRVGQIGASMLRDGERVFTYSTSGSVYEVLRQARADGKRLEVVTTEARPAREGLRTVEEMRLLGVPVTVGIDGGVGGLLRSCDSMWVGADTISATGDALCKTGTFPAALVAAAYMIPVRVVADTSKYDEATAAGAPLPVRQLAGSFLLSDVELEYATAQIPLFEIVPARLIDAIVSEVGVVSPGALATHALNRPRSIMVQELVIANAERIKAATALSTSTASATR
jgi:ribose 1,5-bisphosphate isomerase